MAVFKGMGPRTIVLLAIGIYVLAFTLPDAIAELFNVTTTDWSTGAAQLWDLIPLVIVATILLIFVPRGDDS